MPVCSRAPRQSILPLSYLTMQPREGGRRAVSQRRMYCLPRKNALDIARRRLASMLKLDRGTGRGHLREGFSKHSLPKWWDCAHGQAARLYGQGCVVSWRLSLLLVIRSRPALKHDDGHAGNEDEVFLSNYRVPRVCLGFSGDAALPCLAQLGIDEVGWTTPRGWRTVSEPHVFIESLCRHLCSTVCNCIKPLETQTLP